MMMSRSLRWTKSLRRSLALWSWFTTGTQTSSSVTRYRCCPGVICFSAPPRWALTSPRSCLGSRTLPERLGSMRTRISGEQVIRRRLRLLAGSCWMCGGWWDMRWDGVLSTPVKIQVPSSLGRICKRPRANALGTSTNPPSAFGDI